MPRGRTVPRRTRHPMRGDEAAPCSCAGRGGAAMSRVASSRAGRRCRLGPARGEEASPHPTHGDEVSHRPCARRLRFRRYCTVAGGSRTVSCRIVSTGALTHGTPVCTGVLERKKKRDKRRDSGGRRKEEGRRGNGGGRRKKGSCGGEGRTTRRRDGSVPRKKKECGGNDVGSD
ncbi:hypothetical protein B296_00019037 [Ensete ventricosum]|uniref:Uncharacterized protein n=1 Tax=Ensete ventricosum TaxID=4639 RepID=A0A427ALK5_ENSVE|nr:hypothetical protein B296_00019037 [Ensete ventricosum]